jgi:hypothetical protein
MLLPRAQKQVLDRRLSDRPVASASRLDVLRVNTRRPPRGKASLVGLLATIEVDPFNIEGMDMSGNVAEDCQADVDEEISKLLVNVV